MFRVKLSQALMMVIVILFSLSGCGFFDQHCTDELVLYVEPSEKVISVGESFKIDVKGTTCGGEKEVDLDWQFISEDTNIASVDSKGLVTGENHGHTRIGVMMPNDQNPVHWIDIVVN